MRRLCLDLRQGLVAVKRPALPVAGALLILLTAGAVTGLAARAALSAAEGLQGAQRGLSAAAGQREPQQVREALEAAQRDVAHAEESLSAWPVDVVAAVPLLGRSWRAERAVARTARHVLAGASAVADGLPAVRAAGGGVDLTALERVLADLDAPTEQAGAALARLQSTPVALTPAPVRAGVLSAQEGLAPVVAGLERLHTGLGVLSGVLGADGPRSLLVMLQNNAELRGAGGYSASFATGRLEAGRLELDALREVVSVADPPERARRVAAPEEYVEDFGALSGNTTMWRSWNVSPHVPDSALVGARVAAALLPVRPDVVVLLDVPALAELAALGGRPIDLPNGTSITSDQLTQALLVDAYAAAGPDVPAQEARRAALQTAATTAVTRLLSGEVEAAEAVSTVARLASQRHLSIWSARPEEQSDLVRLGAAGAVQPPEGGDLLSVSVNNVGANKLDQYVQRDVSVEVVLEHGSAEVHQQVRLANRSPADLVPYVAGFERPGTVVSLVELSMPAEASLVSASVDGGPWSGTRHTGGPRQRLHTRIEIPRGRDAVLELRYRLPYSGPYRLRLVPQPLVRDAGLELTVSPAEAVRMGRVRGATRTGDRVSESSAFSEVRDVEIEVLPITASRWQRLRDWWSDPSPG